MHNRLYIDFYSDADPSYYYDNYLCYETEGDYSYTYTQTVPNHNNYRKETMTGNSTDQSGDAYIDYDYWDQYLSGSVGLSGSGLIYY